ncbi:hypothetical protein SUNI508_09594 [Seiridium unicorne]|uniref:Uncharacterized protein n=1 Tax=Seiridium unicorne TaxID=138068 RepID=A0ABR2UQR2_9PEZI
MRRSALALLIAIVLIISLGLQVRLSIRSSRFSMKRVNAFVHFKHQGPTCQLSSLDLYEPHSQTCPTRTLMLEAMSSGGRVGRDSPYTSRGCDMIWYTTEEVCVILGRFSQILLVGDSMLRHIIGAINILIREDLGYGAVTDWNFNQAERRECFCLNQFNVKTCSVQGIYKTSDVLANDPGSLACPKLIPVEQINSFPIPNDELMRLRASVHASQMEGSSKPSAFILGHGLWNNLEIEASIHWLDSVLSVINREADFQAPTLLVTPNAAGKDKPDRWLMTQGNEALVRFEEVMADAAIEQGIDHLGTWNMSIQATLYDGVHLDMRGNLLKAMMVVNWLALLSD